MIWLAASYLVGLAALAIAVGGRLRARRTAHEQLAAMQRRRLGL